MRMLTIDEKDMSPETDGEIRRCLCECFPADKGFFSRSRAWHGSAPAFSVLLYEDSKLVSHVGLVDRCISIGGSKARVAGVQNVFVLPSHRGKGLSDKVMTKAMEEAGIRGYDFGILFCVPQIEKVYSRCGWRTLGERDVMRTDETGSDLPIPGKNIAMFHPLLRKDFPEGTIHLCGNDW